MPLDRRFRENFVRLNKSLIQWIPPQSDRLSPEFSCFPSVRGVRDGTSARYKRISIWTWDPQNHTGSASLDVYWCLLQDKVFLSSEGLHSSPASWLCWIFFFFSPVTFYVLISTPVPLLSGCTELMRQVLILLLILKIRNSTWWKSWDFFRQVTACHSLSK